MLDYPVLLIINWRRFDVEPGFFKINITQIVYEHILYYDKGQGRKLDG